MTVALLQNLPQRITDANGAVVASPLVYTYVAGTTTDKTAYQDSAGSVPHANPIVGNVDGTLPQIWLSTDSLYRIQVWTNDGLTKLHDWDNISAASSAFAFSDSSSTSHGDALVAVKQPFTGAIARTQHDKNADIVSVKDFDGTDTVAIQAAFNSGAGFVIVPFDTYSLTATLTVPSNVHIYSFGATFQRQAGAGAFDMIQNSDQVGGNTNIVIEGLILDGNKTADGLDPVNAGDRFCGISLKNVSGKSRVARCTVTGTVNNETGAGIYLSTCSDVLVEDNHGYGNDRTAIYYTGGARNRFIGNRCHDNAGSGISGSGCDDAEFSGNRTYSNGSAGNYSGLNASCLRARVERNLSYSNTGTGITLGETASADASDASVAGNTAYDNTLDGIYVANSARVKLRGNTVKDNAKNASRANIHIKSDASFCTIAKNTVKGGAGTGAAGILLDGGKGHKILGNGVSGAYSSGIDILAAATDGIIQGNVCYDNCVGSAANAGIYLESTSGWTVQGNRCFDQLGASGTQTSGIYVFGGSNNKLIGNDCVGNKTNGILEGGSPSYDRRMNKIGTDKSQDSFSPSAGATYTVPNNNSQFATRIKFFPRNAAAAQKPIYVSAVSAGVSFTVAPGTGSFAGGESYGYEIE